MILSEENIVDLSPQENEKIHSFTYSELSDLQRNNIKKLCSHDILTAKEEVELFEKLNSETDEVKKNEIIEELILKNQKIIFKAASKYNFIYKSIGLFELWSVGNETLVDCIGTFKADITGTRRFASYLFTATSRQMIKYINANLNIVRVSNYMKDRFNFKFIHLNANNFSNDADDVEKIEKFLIDEEFEHKKNNEIDIKIILKKIKYKLDRRIIELFFLEEKSLEEVGKELNVSRETVRLKKNQILDRLKISVLKRTKPRKIIKKQSKLDREEKRIKRINLIAMRKKINRSKICKKYREKINSLKAKNSF